MVFDIFTIASWVGGIAFAISGFLVGVRKDLDVMGIFIVSMLTANGGGVVRDVLVGQTPRLLMDMSGFYLVLGVFIFAFLIKLQRHAHLEKNRLFVACDALGLAAFSVTGAMVGLEANLNIFGVMVLAFITASGGGIIRDLMVNEVPAVLSSDFYGSIAILLGAGIFALHHLGLDSNTNLTILFVVALGLRLVAYLKGWRLPRIKT